MLSSCRRIMFPNHNYLLELKPKQANKHPIIFHLIESTLDSQCVSPIAGGFQVGWGLQGCLRVGLSAECGETYSAHRQSCSDAQVRCFVKKLLCKHDCVRTMESRPRVTSAGGVGGGVTWLHSQEEVQELR